VLPSAVHAVHAVHADCACLPNAAGSEAPTWTSLLRHATQLAMPATAASQPRHDLLVLARADVVWPRTFGCISPAAMKSAAAALTFSCQIRLRTCAPRKYAAAANWSEAYRSCRERETVAKCAPLTDGCYKYSGVVRATDD
jgi:hypothetical protein